MMNSDVMFKENQDFLSLSLAARDQQRLFYSDLCEILFSSGDQMAEHTCANRDIEIIPNQRTERSGKIRQKTASDLI